MPRHLLHPLLALILLASAGCSDSPPAQRDGPPVIPLPDGAQSWPEAGLDAGPKDGAMPVDGAAPTEASTPDSGHDLLTPDSAKPLRDDALPAWDWYTKGSKITSRNALPAAFTAAGYTPPQGLYLVVARVVPGLGQPGMQLFSYHDTGFTYSTGHFWPASTIKLAAAVGALWTLGKLGLSGDAEVSFTDDDGSYSGTVAKLYDLALRISDNVAYNRLAEIAGFDELNDAFLVEARGLPQMVLQRRYTHPTPGSNLRTSPPISYSEGTKSGTIPKRVGVGVHPACPKEGNCTTLFEILDLMRRVTLHGELPSAERLPLQAKDQTRLMTALRLAASHMEAGATQALGHAVTVYNKTGTVPNNERLDHGLIVDKVSGERFLIALSLPYNTTSTSTITTVTKQALLALAVMPTDGAVLQRDAGATIILQADDRGAGTAPNTRAYTLTVSAPGADTVKLWADGWPLGVATKSGPYFELDYDFSQSGERLVVVEARAAGKLVGYRSLRLRVN